MVNKFYNNFITLCFSNDDTTEWANAKLGNFLARLHWWAYEFERRRQRKKWIPRKNYMIEFKNTEHIKTILASEDDYCPIIGQFLDKDCMGIVMNYVLFNDKCPVLYVEYFIRCAYCNNSKSSSIM